jgi:hypothetical protein
MPAIQASTKEKAAFIATANDDPRGSIVEALKTYTAWQQANIVRSLVAGKRIRKSERVNGPRRLPLLPVHCSGR